MNRAKFRAGSLRGGGRSRSVAKGPSSSVHQQAVFCPPRKQEHFLKLSLSFSGVHIENQRCTGIYKHVFYFSVGMLLFFNAVRIEMGNSAIQGKMYLISYHYLKNPL